MFLRKKDRNPLRARKGSAAVEAAICLPVLAFIVFAAVEVSGGVFQDYDAHAVTFELGKTALRANSTCEDIQVKAGMLLPMAGFENYELRIDVEPRTVNGESVEPAAVTSFLIPQSGAAPEGLDEVPRGTLLRLTLTADRPAIAGRGLFRQVLSGSINADVVFVKENN